MTSALNNFDMDLKNLFSEAPIKFIVDQQTMINLRILVEVIGSNNLMLTPDAHSTMGSLKESFNKDKHRSLEMLEKQLLKENLIGLLKFFNSDNSFVTDEMAINKIEMVNSSYLESHPEFSWPS